MKTIIVYFKESYNELMHKVTWPSWEELQGSALLVMVASMDVTFKKLMTGIYEMFYH
jgi:preprotein translocase subunit SecE